MTKLAIGYRKNPAYVDGVPERNGASSTPDVPRLFATINLAQFGADARVSDLPIYFRLLEKPIGPIRVVYSTRVAGLTIERGNLESLAGVINTFLGALIRFERLPRYMFNVADSAWPIYELTGQLVARYPGGPVFSASTIAELWINLANHFKHIGRIASRRDLSILYLSPDDLQLYAPDFTLRSSAAADIPVFATRTKSRSAAGRNGQGMQLLAPVNGHSLSVPMNGGNEILELAEEVGRYLVSHGRLAGSLDLSIRRLAAHRWLGLQQTLEPSGEALLVQIEVARGKAERQMPMFRLSQGYVAARESRPARMTLYLASDVPTLQSRLSDDLYSQGLISSPGSVSIGRASLERDEPALAASDELPATDADLNRRPAQGR